MYHVYLISFHASPRTLGIFIKGKNMSRQKSSLPIGVFDSGMGGLTVLKELKSLLPNESFLYLGDTARLPYGTKSKETVVKYALQMAELLIKKGIKLLVIACNTATMASLAILKKTHPELPIIGVISPGANAAAAAIKHHKKVLVLATEATVNSGIYSQAIKNINTSVEVCSLACGLFVALAEEGCITDDVSQVVIKKYLSQYNLNEFDCILLGCTHFPLLKADIQKYVGKEITIVDSGIETSKLVKEALDTLNINNRDDKNTLCFLVTDLPERFVRVGKMFLQSDIQMKDVEVVNPVI